MCVLNRIFLYPINLKCCRPLNLLPGHNYYHKPIHNSMFLPKIKTIIDRNRCKDKELGKNLTVHIFSVYNHCLNWSE